MQRPSDTPTDHRTRGQRFADAMVDADPMYPDYVKLGWVSGQKINVPRYPTVSQADFARDFRKILADAVDAELS